MSKVAPRERRWPSSRQAERALRQSKEPSVRQRPSGAARRAALALLATTAVGAAALGTAAPAALAADQPWGFEQVTPPVKGAGMVTYIDGFRPSADGNAFLYTTTVPFTSVPAESSTMNTRYLGWRGPDSWLNRGVDPPWVTPIGLNALVVTMLTLATSADLSHAFVTTASALTPGATEGRGNLYMRDMRTGAYTLIATSSHPGFSGGIPSGALNVKYVAPDGRAALFVSSAPLVPGAPDNGMTGMAGLYSWTASGGLRVESVLPDSEGGDIVGISAAHNDRESGAARDSMPRSNGLDHIYFGAGIADPAPGAGAAGPVYVRSGGETRMVTYKRIPGDPPTPVPSTVHAVSDGGRYALVETIARDLQFGSPRLTEDTPVSADSSPTYLYRYDVENDSLDYVADAGFLGLDVVQMTQDGQTIAFQSREALTGDAVEDQFNMYVWRDGSLRFVATADTDSSRGYGYSAYLRVLSPNGRYLSFTDSSASMAQRFGLDNSSLSCPPRYSTSGVGPCNQVYLYDVDAGELTCVSCRTDGQAPNGHAGDTLSDPGSLRMDSHQMQTVADDGTVYFSTPDDLLPADGNGAYDVYASHAGQLRLVSRGTQGTFARFLDATPDGRTAFFATNDAIAGTDADRSSDVYMTRAGAGFPFTSPDVAPRCSGSDCRDPLAPPAELPMIGSVAFGPGNPPLPPGGAAKPAFKVTGKAGRLTVRVPRAGTITASGPSIKQAQRAARKAGTYSLAVALNAKAKKALAKKRSLKAAVRVTFAPKGGKATSKTLSLTFKAPKTKGGR